MAKKRSPAQTFAQKRNWSKFIITGIQTNCNKFSQSKHFSIKERVQLSEIASICRNILSLWNTNQDY